MGYISNLAYYTNGGVNPSDANWGSYQYMPLSDIINNFMLMFVGNDKLLNNVDRYNVMFHAKTAIKELNYDAMRNIKAMEIEIDNSLKLVLPPDFVNFVRISLEVNGKLIPMEENRGLTSVAGYLQDNNYDILFDSDGSVLVGDAKIDIDRLNGVDQSLYTGSGQFNNCYGWNVDDEWYFGRRFGAEPSEMNISPKYKLNRASGVIDFNSDMAGQFIVLEYVSDGMENGDDAKVGVNKLFEQYVYAYIKWALLNNKYGVQEYVIRRAQKEKSALLANARIRISKLHPSMLLMSLRGRDKHIK